MKTLLDLVTTPPQPFDRARAQRALLSMLQHARTMKEDQTQSVVPTLLSSSKVRKLSRGVFGNSPYLKRLATKDPEYFYSVLQQSPQHELDSILREITEAAVPATTEQDWMRLLRIAKQRAAMLLAVADLGNVWPVEKITDALTGFAETCVQQTVRWLFMTETERSRGEGDSEPSTEGESGFFVLGMGKFGGFELNYSSDIDLIVFFDSEKLSAVVDTEPQLFAIGLTKKLVFILNELTADGYVFRVDLRLRPDAGATQVALSTEAAEIYYETFGQNWERAAFIKARVVGGDKKAGDQFLADLSPFIWRRYLDYASIEDVHSIKRQIHAHGGHRDIAVNGHDVKLGWGGIREIEFFAQTQQLILGGRDPTLRGKSTCETLLCLSDRGMIGATVVDELTQGYRFLRMVEHRLQMVEDQQTHTLPDDDEGVSHIAAFCGYETVAEFREDLLRTLTIVREHYDSLFEREAPLSKETGSLVFTGVDDDPETLSSLTKLGFARPKQISSAIRSWHHGRLRATRSERARQKLTAIVPVLLETFSKGPDPDSAFGRFNRFVEGLPSGVQLFAMLHSNPDLLSLLSTVLGNAPRLSPILAAKAQLLDAVIEPGYLEQLPPLAELKLELSERVRAVGSYEDVLDEARRWTNEQSLRIGIQVLTGRTDANLTGYAYAALAETVVSTMLPITEDYVAQKHGRIAGGEMAVLAMGKLGSREMNAGSDLDLIFIYDAPDPDALSDGPQPLSVTQYFMRLSQRFINALTAQTSEGGLFEVDMRLRPSGNSGPLATSLARFESYQLNDAWTWEHMAMTRARVLCGSDVLTSKIDHIIADILCRGGDRHALAQDVLDMRQKIENEYASTNPLELKNVRGGLLDLEFICQFLQLGYADEYPEILRVNTQQSLFEIAKTNILSPNAAAELVQAARHYQNIIQITRIAFEGTFDVKDISADLEKILCTAVDCDTLVELENHLRSLQASVWDQFSSIVENSARH